MDEIVYGKNGKQTHIRGRLMAESLVDRDVMRSTAAPRELDILPDVNVVGIGGHSIMDRGRKAILPLLEEIVKNKKKHKMILGVSGGTRTRHVFSIALDLGIPTGGLAHVAGASEEQNEKILQALLAKHGGIQMTKDHFWDIPHKLASGMIPIMIGMPPYHYWEQPPRKGRLPMNGSDLGLFTFAESLGARSLIYVKDRDGLYTADPAKEPGAALIKRIGARELLRRELPDLIIEPMVLETLVRARHVREIRIVNGLKKGSLTKALDGKPCGTVIYQERA
jgi:molybdenum storage protein